MKRATMNIFIAKIHPGEGEGLFHRAISHSGTMLMPIDVSPSLPIPIFMPKLMPIEVPQCPMAIIKQSFADHQ